MAINADFAGFSAFATSSSQDLGAGDVVEFPAVVTNAGDAYNRVTSRSTCPTTAYYYFYYNLHIDLESPDHEFCYIEVVMDGSRVTMVSYTRDRYSYCIAH